jgi:hypothetical protein
MQQSSRTTGSTNAQVNPVDRIMDRRDTIRKFWFELYELFAVLGGVVISNGEWPLCVLIK